MTVRVGSRLVPVPAALVALVALATVAVAVMTIPIKDSQVPVRASEFEEREDCDFPGTAGQPGSWGWHFVLPGGSATFVSLTAEFEDAGTVTLPGPSGAFVQDGKGAVVYTPTDDTLIDAEASIEGETPQGYFVLSHVCAPAATPSPSVSATSTPSPSVSPSETGTPSPTVSATTTTSPSASVTVSASESESATPSAEVSGTVITSSPGQSASVTPSVLGARETRGGVGGVGGVGLPTTGSRALALLVTGLLMVLAGVVLLTRPRGRHAR